MYDLPPGRANQEQPARGPEMRILISNDDGVDAPGLAALYRACSPLGEVFVVAPAHEQSAGSHAVTLGRPITVREVSHPLFGRAFAVEGSPADCIRLGVAELVGQPVDFAACGINAGANLGVDTYYSGTVAAAREAAILGVPAVAVSQFVGGNVIGDWGDVPIDWDRAAALAGPVLTKLVARIGQAPRLWNVNLPTRAAAGRVVSVRVVPLCTGPMPIRYARADRDGDPSRRYQYTGAYTDRGIHPDTDVSVVFGGDVAVTPMRIGPTELSALDTLFPLTWPA
jgi:5'-nucleotidase